MTPRHRRQLADVFWADAEAAGLGSRSGLATVPFACVVEAVLPVSIVYRPALTFAAVRQYIGRGGATSMPDETTLRGCLYYTGHTSLIFINADDDATEQRFTCAHETAHLLMHFDAVRDATLAAAGDAARDVLDGLRPASDLERVAAALAGEVLSPHAHIYASPDEHLAEAEADDLALDLLIPEHAWNDTPDAATLSARWQVPVRHVQRGMSRRRRDPLVGWVRTMMTEASP